MGGDIAESPRKRLKTDNVSTEDAVPPSAPTNESDAQSLREAEVGITQFVSADNEGFSGIFKKRYLYPRLIDQTNSETDTPISWSTRSCPLAKSFIFEPSRHRPQRNQSNLSRPRSHRQKAKVVKPRKKRKNPSSNSQMKTMSSWNRISGTKPPKSSRCISGLSPPPNRSRVTLAEFLPRLSRTVINEPRCTRLFGGSSVPNSSPRPILTGSWSSLLLQIGINAEVKVKGDKADNAGRIGTSWAGRSSISPSTRRTKIPWRLSGFLRAR